MRPAERPRIGDAPPFRAVPESCRRIMRTQFVCLGLLLVPAWAFFGPHAGRVVLLAVLGAVVTELAANHLKRERQPGSGTHSAVMGLLVGFMLPADVPSHVPFITAMAGITLGKHFFGGLGHYVWHPALVGRVVAELFFHTELQGTTGPLLTRQHLFWGDLFDQGAARSWLRFDWFEAAPTDHQAIVLDLPGELLRRLQELRVVEATGQLAVYLQENLPPLDHLLWGAVPGPLGTGAIAAVVLVGLYLAYRGYLHWLLPLAFVVGATLAAMCCPVLLAPAEADLGWVAWPFFVQGPMVGVTYVAYQLCAGPLLFCALILSSDMTCRPITRNGQLLFGLAAGIFCIVFRLYTPVPMPCFAAMLFMNAAVPSLDRLTRPRGRRPG